jgi:hexosaminidase
MYFDHPYEPDPEDRGFYWATRITSTKKTFGFMPDSLYENIGVDRMGNPLDKAEICEQWRCTPLEPGKEANIMGML